MTQAAAIRAAGDAMTTGRLASSGGWHTAFAPATIANFGSGFDAFAAAIRVVGSGGALGDTVSVRRTKRRGLRVVEISGDGGRLPRSASRNCAAVAAGAVLRRERAPFGLDLVLRKGLPLSSGLGSSAASAAAGAYASALAVGLAPRPPRAGLTLENLDKSRLLLPALAGEHVADGSWHGDNVFASLVGGGLIVLSTRPAEIVPLRAAPSLRVVVVHPAFELETRRARAALPKRVTIADAASQAGRFASFVAAWPRGDRRGVGRGLEDRFAEPYRARLVPGYSEGKRAALRAGAYGVTFSGAGPSVVAVTPEGGEAAAGEAIRRAFARAGLASEVLVCRIDAHGAREVKG
jgi:homoserine kinase